MNNTILKILSILLTMSITVITLIGCDLPSITSVIEKKEQSKITTTENVQDSDSSSKISAQSIKKTAPTLSSTNKQNTSSNAVKPITSKEISNPETSISQEISKYESSKSNKNISTEDELYNLIKANLELGNDTVTKFNNTSNINIGKLAIKAANDNGYGGYISNVEYSVNNNTVYIHFNYKGGRDTFLTKINAVKSKVQSIVSSIIKSNMNDFQKELALHDYIVNNTKYDYDNLLRGTIPDDSFNAYGVLFNKVAVCEGYAEAMYRLLNAAGVKTLIIIGQGNNVDHAWNLVNINGNYYHLDSTFDDPVSNSGDTLSYNYFNLSDNEISKDHTWDTSSYPSCTSTKANYYIVNNLLASNSKDFYNIIYNGLLKKQQTIRCKTSNYDTTTFSPDIISKILQDNPKINYLDTSRGFSYSYDSNSYVMEFFINYK